MAKHHNLDIAPVPDKVLYVKEPELADRTIVDTALQDDTLLQDNVRVYIPLDINREAILRRVRNVYSRYGSRMELSARRTKVYFPIRPIMSNLRPVETTMTMIEIIKKIRRLEIEHPGCVYEGFRMYICQDTGRMHGVVDVELSDGTLYIELLFY